MLQIIKLKKLLDIMDGDILIITMDIIILIITMDVIIEKRL